MIEVDVGGTIVEFPDDTPRDVMKSAIQRRFGGSMPAAPHQIGPLSFGKAQEQIAGGGEQVPAYLQPIANLPQTYRDVRQEAVNQMGRGVNQLSDAAAAEDIMGYPVPTSDRLANAAYGAGNVGLGALGFVASPVNAALRSIVGEPVEKTTGIPKEITETALSFLLPIPGAAGVPRIRSTPVSTPRVFTPGEQVTAAGENLKNVGTSGGIAIPRAVTSDSMAVQRTGATVANAPIVGDPLVKAAGNTTKRLAEKSQEIASEYGSASTITAGDAASTAIKSWIGPKSEAIAQKFYDRVDSLINPNVTTDLSNTRTVAQEILSKRDNAAIARKSEAVGMIENAITKPGGLNYQGIKDLRTYVGEMVDGKRILPADMSGAELKRIYGALSDDLKSSVRQAGGAQAVSAFERANTHYRLISDRREALAKVVGKDGETPAAQVFDRLIKMAGNTTRADMSKLAQARKAMGADAWNEVASGMISQMGRTVDATGNVIFSPQKFLTSYQSELSGPGRAMLFRSAGKENIAPFLDDIARISTRFKELQKFSNPSGTGQTLTGAGMLAGLWAEPMTFISAGIGTHILARALASPATVAPLANWSRKYEMAVRSPSPASVTQLTIASRNLANTMNTQLGTAFQWQDLLKGAQGTVKGRAENEQ